MILGLSAIEYAKAAGLKEAAAEFTRIASMNEINGTEFYNSNLSRLGRLPHHPGSNDCMLISPQNGYRTTSKRNTRISK